MKACSMLAVFLGRKNVNEGGMPYYPAVKLGDFGLAISTYPDDPDNPQCFQNSGTPGYRAPVVKIWYDIYQLLIRD